jgi:hypothetical protein
LPSSFPVYVEFQLAAQPVVHQEEDLILLVGFTHVGALFLYFLIGQPGSIPVGGDSLLDNHGFVAMEPFACTTAIVGVALGVCVMVAVSVTVGVGASVRVGFLVIVGVQSA